MFMYVYIVLYNLGQDWFFLNLENLSFDVLCAE